MEKKLVKLLLVVVLCNIATHSMAFPKYKTIRRYTCYGLGPAIQIQSQQKHQREYINMMRLERKKTTPAAAGLVTVVLPDDLLLRHDEAGENEGCMRKEETSKSNKGNSSEKKNKKTNDVDTVRNK